MGKVALGDGGNVGKLPHLVVSGSCEHLISGGEGAYVGPDLRDDAGQIVAQDDWQAVRQHEFQQTGFDLDLAGSRLRLGPSARRRDRPVVLLMLVRSCPRCPLQQRR